MASTNGQAGDDAASRRAASIAALTDDAKAARRRVQGWFERPLRCTLTDGRTVVGTFLCLDRYRNFIISNTEETRQVLVVQKDGSQVYEEKKRNLGLVMVPGKHLVRVQLRACDWHAPPKDDDDAASDDTAPPPFTTTSDETADEASSLPSTGEIAAPSS